MSGWTWTIPLVMNAIRNPHGYSEELLREARLLAADEIERLERENRDLRAGNEALRKQAREAMDGAGLGHVWELLREARLSILAQHYHATNPLIARIDVKLAGVTSEAQGHECGPSCPHASDCAVHNEPAGPAGQCDCGADEKRVVGWQPIATAPKDGREVLLRVAVRAGIRGKCLVGHYMPGGHCIEDHPAIAEGWYFWNGCEFDKASKPVEWMPLPDEKSEVLSPGEWIDRNVSGPPGLVQAMKNIAGDETPGVACHGLDTPERVCFYEQDFYVLSNFSAFKVEWKGLVFDTSEAAYHWEKFPGKPGLRADIMDAASAHEAFKLAEAHKDWRRPDWDAVKVDIMRRILAAKVSQHEYVRRKLLATGERELVENSWRDPFWGWGPNRDGKNMLGRLWMEVRAELRAGGASPVSHQEIPDAECPKCRMQHFGGTVGWPCSARLPTGSACDGILVSPSAGARP